MGDFLYLSVMKDLSNTLISFIYDYLSHRDDITVQIQTNGKKPYFYRIHILVHMNEHDGLLKTINKGIDKLTLHQQINKYFNLTPNDCRITQQNVYPITSLWV
jgi:hypothetical protein